METIRPALPLKIETLEWFQISGLSGDERYIIIFLKEDSILFLPAWGRAGESNAKTFPRFQIDYNTDQKLEDLFHNEGTTWVRYVRKADSIEDVIKAIKRDCIPPTPPLFIYRGEGHWQDCPYPYHM